MKEYIEKKDENGAAEELKRLGGFSCIGRIVSARPNSIAIRYKKRNGCFTWFRIRCLDAPQSLLRKVRGHFVKVVVLDGRICVSIKSNSQYIGEGGISELGSQRPKTSSISTMKMF